jgi:hypothetical protein
MNKKKKEQRRKENDALNEELDRLDEMFVPTLVQSEKNLKGPREKSVSNKPEDKYMVRYTRTINVNFWFQLKFWVWVKH